MEEYKFDGMGPLSTGLATAGTTLMDLQIYDQLLRAKQAKTFTRNYAAMIMGPNSIRGSSITFNLETIGQKFVQVGEGAEFPMGVDRKSVV